MAVLSGASLSHEEAPIVIRQAFPLNAKSALGLNEADFAALGAQGLHDRCCFKELGCLPDLQGGDRDKLHAAAWWMT
jgi:hypothetical protein